MIVGFDIDVIKDRKIDGRIDGKEFVGFVRVRDKNNNMILDIFDGDYMHGEYDFEFSDDNCCYEIIVGNNRERVSLQCIYPKTLH